MEDASATPDDLQPYEELGLRPDEYQRIKEVLGRRPTQSELAMYSIMWSEHCSYKSSKVHLKQFAEKAPASDRLLAGIGENAGVIQISDDLAVTFKVESHNHPSLRGALPGGRHRGRRHRPGHPGDGRPASRGHGPAPLRRRPPPGHRTGAHRGGRRHRRLRQLSGTAKHRR